MQTKTNTTNTVIKCYHPALPDFTDPVAAARAWADECEAKIAAQAELAFERESHANTRERLALVEKQRDRAIREKALARTGHGWK